MRERAIVDRADVVLATCAGCDHSFIRDRVFDCVIVDEATQAPGSAAARRAVPREGRGARW